MELGHVQKVLDWRCPCCGNRGGRQRIVARSTPDCIFLQVLRFEAGPGGLRKTQQSSPVPVEGLRIAAMRDGVIDRGVDYVLRAVLLHEGELAGGHYWTLALRQGDWFRMDDSKTSHLRDGIPAGIEHLVYGLLLQWRG
jgi:ubiquitin C-terminal hydrolase